MEMLKVNSEYSTQGQTPSQLEQTVNNFIDNVRGKGMITLIPLWILDSVTNYCIQPDLFSQYSIQ